MSRSRARAGSRAKSVYLAAVRPSQPGWRTTARPPAVADNGKRAAGNPAPRLRGTHQSSRAFLAFAETWLK